MSYRRSATVHQIQCGSDFVPAGVAIGKRGITINKMKEISGAKIWVSDNVLKIRGDHKQMMTAKMLCRELKQNYSKGIYGLTTTSRPKRQQRRIRINTKPTGWSHIEDSAAASAAAPAAVEQTPQEPKKVVYASNTRFSGLDFGSDTDSESDDEAVINEEAKQEFPSLPTSPAIKLTIREKASTRMDQWKKMRAEKVAARAEARVAAGLPASASWADICDEEDERKRLGIDSDDEVEGLFLQNY